MCFLLVCKIGVILKVKMWQAWFIMQFDIENVVAKNVSAVL